MLLAAAAILDIAEDERLRMNVIRELRINRKRLRDASNPFDADPEYFRKLYRMTPEVAFELTHLLHGRLERQGPNKIPPHLEVLIALRFFGEGGYQKGVGQDYNHPVSQTTVSRCIERVVNSLVDMGDRFIKFPQTQQERQQVRQRFQEYIRIPSILGIIDCILVSFVRPCEQEEAFYNYKGYHALNVQVICDVDYLIRNVRICPGSNNDRYVWQYSSIKQYMEHLRADENITREEGRYYILGDSGYTPSPILLTPVRNPPGGSPAAVYTEELVKTRCRVEQLFGMWTGVWRCIKRQRKLCYRDPEKVAKIVTACAVLYNFCRLHGIQDDPMDEHIDVNDNHENCNNGFHAGIAERERIIHTYYV